MSKKVICVTGTRTNERAGDCEHWLSELKPDLVLVGDATGIDAEARSWCKKNKVPLIVFCATTEWPDAGPKRNNLLAWTAAQIQKQNPDTSFIAFPLGEARGTKNAVLAFRKHGIGGFVHGEGHPPAQHVGHTVTA